MNKIALLATLVLLRFFQEASAEELQYSPFNLNNPPPGTVVPIANGGTGATSAAGALSNLSNSALSSSAAVTNTAATAAATQSAAYYLPFSTNAGISNGEIVTGTNIPTGTLAAYVSGGTSVISTTAPVAQGTSANPIGVTSRAGIVQGMMFLDTTTPSAIVNNTIVTSAAGNTTASSTTSTGTSSSGQKTLNVSSGTSCTTGSVVFDLTNASSIAPNTVATSQSSSTIVLSNNIATTISSGDTINCYGAVILNNASSASTLIGANDTLSFYPTVTLTAPTSGVVANGATITFQTNSATLANNNLAVTGSQSVTGNLNVGGNVNLPGGSGSGQPVLSLTGHAYVGSVSGSVSGPMVYVGVNGQAVPTNLDLNGEGFVIAYPNGYSGGANAYSLYVNGSEIAGLGVNGNLLLSSILTFSGGDSIVNKGSGVIVFDEGGGGLAAWTRLAFGNNTSSFPALQVNGSGLNAELGDGSNLTFFEDTGTISGGTKATVTGCSNSATTGGATAGTYTSGTTGTCTVTVTLNGATGITAPNGWACFAYDLTTQADYTQKVIPPVTASSVTFSGTTVSGDVIYWACPQGF